MSGQVIPFQGHRRLSSPRNIAGSRSLEHQVARIADLLEELEDLTRSTMDLAPSVMARTRLAMDRARAVMGGLEGAGESDAGDPQPEIDSELVARLYRELSPEG